ncbi:MAG: KilA-N domain-containing protein [Lutibacter sp.]|jgi:hypothetical protein
MSQKTETPTENVVEFLYQETQIHFLVNPNERDVMINATEMAKMFDKRIDVYLKTQPTKAFIEALQFTPVGGNSTPLSYEQIIQTKGHLGTFMHRKLALDFAAWLDVNFRVWIINTIDEILFSKTEPIANAVSLKQKQESEQKALIEKATLEKNEDFLSYIKLQKAIKKTTSLENKALNNLKSQYKINF